MSVKVRSLKAKDARKLVEILSSSLGDKFEQSGGKIELAPGDFVKMLKQNVGPLWAFLADLADMTPEQLDEAELSAPLDIIEALGNSPEAADFFERVFRLLGLGKKSDKS